MQTPEKNPLKRGFGGGEGFTSPTKKTLLAGYVLHVSPIQKSGKNVYYFIQMQLSENSTTKFVAYNRNLHATLIAHKERGERVKIEVRKNEVTNSIVFGTYCKVYPASVTDVLFPLNQRLKKDIAVKNTCRAVNISEFEKMDPSQNTERFSIKVKLLIGPDDLHEITSYWGTGRVKRDIQATDASGGIQLQMFEKKFQQVKNNFCYQITHVVLKQFRSDTYLQLTAESEITEIEELGDVASTSTQCFSKLSSHYVEFFDSIRKIRFFYKCKSCKKNMNIEDFTAKMIRCANGYCDTNNRTANLKVLSSCEVNITLDDGSDIWLTMFSDVIQKVVGDIQSAVILDNALMGLKNFTVVFQKEKMVVEHITMSTEEESDEENEKNPITSKNAEEQHATLGVQKNDEEEHITMSTEEENDEEKENKKKKKSNKKRKKNHDMSKNGEERHATPGDKCDQS